MIQNSDKIQKMLNRIIKQLTIVKNDFNFNKKTSREFMLNKLNKAKIDLEVLIDYAEVRKEKK